MTKERLDQILNEKANNYETYKANGYAYFEEVLPIICDFIDKSLVKPVEAKPLKKAEVKKVVKKKK